MSVDVLVCVFVCWDVWDVYRCSVVACIHV